MFFGGWFEEARVTATDEQPAILENARDAGVLEEADVHAALERMLQCFEDAGIT